jgi:hypothetical protein
MQKIGFSTGALALSDFRLALLLLSDTPCDAIELSALRESELLPLVNALDSLDLGKYSAISLHAPSSISPELELQSVALLDETAKRGWTIVLHPDAITNYSAWKHFGDLLAIENMDKRKRAGRTRDELCRVFDELPQASFCFDIGHARQVDPSMAEAGLMLREFRGRLKHLHVSEVNTQSKHNPMSLAAVLAFKKVLHLIPEDATLIIESRIDDKGRILREIENVMDLFCRPAQQLAGD